MRLALGSDAKWWNHLWQSDRAGGGLPQPLPGCPSPSLPTTAALSKLPCHSLGPELSALGGNQPSPSPLPCRAQSLIRTDEIIRTWVRRMLAKRDGGALITHMARLQRRWACECCQRRQTAPWGAGGPSRRRWNWNPAEWSWVRARASLDKGHREQGLSVTWQTGAAHSALSKLCWPVSWPLRALPSALEAMGLWKEGEEPNEFLRSCWHQVTGDRVTRSPPRKWNEHKCHLTMSFQALHVSWMSPKCPHVGDAHLSERGSPKLSFCGEWGSRHQGGGNKAHTELGCGGLAWHFNLWGSQLWTNVVPALPPGRWPVSFCTVRDCPNSLSLPTWHSMTLPCAAGHVSVGAQPRSCWGTPGARSPREAAERGTALAGH